MRSNSQKESRFYSDRIAGGDCDYCHLDGFVIAGGPAGPRGGPPGPLQKQSQADHVGASQLSQHARDFSLRPILLPIGHRLLQQRLFMGRVGDGRLRCCLMSIKRPIYNRLNFSLSMRDPGQPQSPGDFDPLVPLPQRRHAAGGDPSLGGPRALARADCHLELLRQRGFVRVQLSGPATGPGRGADERRPRTGFRPPVSRHHRRAFQHLSGRGSHPLRFSVGSRLYTDITAPRMRAKPAARWPWCGSAVGA